VVRSCRSPGHSPLPKSPGSVFLDGRQATSCEDACASSLLDDFSGLTRVLGSPSCSGPRAVACADNMAVSKIRLPQAPAVFSAVTRRERRSGAERLDGCSAPDHGRSQ
jgi:hypothetical protein